jgi:intracellular sulfur oxidation DsrE/DsrF family protein
MSKTILLVLASVIFMLPFSGIGKTNVKHRIIMQLSSGDTTEWKGTVNNIRNLKKGWGEDVVIEIVAHGPGISFLMKSRTTQHAMIKVLSKQGVIFLACENTMKEKKIDKSEILPEAEFVPMGIGEIVLKQEQGWTYIKGGF